MTTTGDRIRTQPLLLGLFEKRFDGDDALLELASQRFRKAGLGMECSAPSVEALEHLLQFRPDAAAPAVIHLRRDLNLFKQASRDHILRLAGHFGDRITGLVIHDQHDVAVRFHDYCSMLQELDAALTVPLFVEYAAGLDPHVYVSLFKAIQPLHSIRSCLDIGHLGLHQVRETYARIHGDNNIFALHPEDRHLPHVIDPVQQAIESALPTVLAVIEGLAPLGKPIHFHLHDGHPLSTVSFYGVSDHLGFFDTVPIPFEYQGRHTLPLMFGPDGLVKILECCRRLTAPEHLSFTLEIHPKEEALPLGNYASLFQNWHDTINAERTNAWLEVLQENADLVRKTWS